MKKDKQPKLRKKKPAQRKPDMSRQLEQYLKTDDASEIAIAIDVMRLANEARRGDFSKLLQSEPYHRRSL